MKNRKVPMRTCVGCRQKQEKKTLLRIVRSPDGNVCVDDSGKRPGRGAYLCKSEACFKRAIRNESLAKALDIELGDDLIVELSTQVREHEG